MHKPWLTQLVTDSGFPLLVLALAVSQIKLEPRRNANLLHRNRQSTELRSNDRRPKEIRKNGSNNPNENAGVAGRPISTNN
jgi:hypothetical protein